MSDGSTSVGRNAPCPCGSGRKYKKCCGRVDRGELDETGLRFPQMGLSGGIVGRAAGAAGAAGDASGAPIAPAAPLPFVGRFTEQEHDSAIQKLMRYSERREFREGFAIAAALFFGPDMESLGGVKIDELMSHDLLSINLSAFFAVDLEIDDGYTILDDFLSRRGDRLGPGERSFLEALGRSCVRVHEVVESRPGEGLRLRDLWDDSVLWVEEHGASQVLVKGDIIGARVMGRPDGRWVMEGDLYPFSAVDRQEIITSLRDAHRDFKRHFPDAPIDRFFKRSAAHCLGPLVLDRMMAGPPTLTTSEGDVIEFGKGIFDVSDIDALVRVLDAAPQFESEDEADSERRWCWMEPDGRGGQSMKASLRPMGDWLIVEALSRKRMKGVRDLLKALAGGIVRHRSTQYEDQDIAMDRYRRRKAAGQAPEESPVIEIDPEITRKFLDDHYRRWVDEPVPALGDRTPRHAVTLKTQRPRVVELLEQFENKEARDERNTGQPAYDFTWVWEELGLAGERTS